MKGGTTMNSFYSSAYTSQGFRSIKLNSLDPDCFRYILKGKSDSVKQQIIKSVCCELDKRNLKYTVSLNYDGRITGVHCAEKGFIVCDGTYPFSQDVKTYGAVDGVISLEVFQDSKTLRQYSQDIVSLNEAVINHERRCERFLSAAAGLYEDKKRLEKDNIDTRKISRYTAKLWSTHGCHPSGKVGVEKKVFLSVATKDGIKKCERDISEICDTAIVMNDITGASADMIADRIRRYALSSGVDIISCQSYLQPDGIPEHVIVPALRFGVFRENVKVPNIKKVRATRFLLKEPAENIRVRLQFNQRANNSLMKEVTESIKKIAEYNRKLDVIYEQATDENALLEYVHSRLFDIGE